MILHTHYLLFGSTGTYWTARIARVVITYIDMGAHRLIS
jgi:hypothetical protein